MLPLKESIFKEIEKTELEIDSLEGEFKSVNLYLKKSTFLIKKIVDILHQRSHRGQIRQSIYCKTVVLLANSGLIMWLSLIQDYFIVFVHIETLNFCNLTVHAM